MLLVVGALSNRMGAVLWIIAVLSNVTALQRVVYTLLSLKRGFGLTRTATGARGPGNGLANGPGLTVP